MAVELLKSCTVDSILTTKSAPIVVHSEQTVNEVLEELSKNHITSAPVLNLATKKPLGFVDMLDLVWFALDLAKGTPGKHDVVSRTTLFGNQSVKRLVGNSLRNPFIPLRLGSTLLDVAKITQQGVHRVPIMNQSDEIVGIVSQSDIVAFLLENESKLEGELDTAISFFGGTILHRVVATSSDTMTLDAFELMFSRGVNSVAITNADGRLVGNLSPSDLKGLVGRAFVNLLDPVKEFLKVCRLQKHQGLDFTAFVKKNATMKDCVEKMVQNRIHRVWVVDEELHPIGVVSLTDVIWHLLGSQ